ncbi:hypothetical protein AFLA_001901 [Aspergillus flavus NRRL3357]|nr:hypothetical protein AFLA_001901 [Aspergillus flavus NRRL3357]
MVRSWLQYCSGHRLQDERLTHTHSLTTTVTSTIDIANPPPFRFWINTTGATLDETVGSAIGFQRFFLPSSVALGRCDLGCTHPIHNPPPSITLVN